RSEVHDADVDLAAIVARPPHLTRNTSQVGLREKLGHYRTTPVFQMEISRSSLSSLRAGLPEAVSMINCMSLAVASSRLVPSRSWPASKSIQRGFFCASAELEAILSVGTGKPSGVPRPVVNNSRVAPAATSAVEETASLPGASRMASPGRDARWP